MRTYRAYWTTPLVPSSEGRGTSRRGPERLVPAPWGVNWLALRFALVAIPAAAYRKGTMAVMGFAVTRQHFHPEQPISIPLENPRSTRAEREDFAHLAGPLRPRSAWTGAL